MGRPGPGVDSPGPGTAQSWRAAPVTGRVRARHLGRRTARTRVFRHPAPGLLRYEHHRLAPADHPDLHLVVYVPVG
ncbi:hypothetical protein [Nocardia testacea]|uniref:AraC family transcriptional regulator n=1 Tax=Nocardia testacea TaxID=248551 RepID=A0ABW7VV48_9NOCA